MADALSPRSYLTLNHLLPILPELCEDFKRLELNVLAMEGKSILFAMEVQPIVIEEIHVAQGTNP